MRWLNDDRMRVVVLGFVAVVVLGGITAKADFVFGEPTNLGINVNSGACDDALSISSDGLSIIFSSDRPDWGTWDLYMSTRKTTEDEWDPAVKLSSTMNCPCNESYPTVNGPCSESYPSLSADGLELFYTAPFWQDGWTQFGGADLWVSTRASVSDAWSAPVNLGESINTSSHDTEPSISADGLELYFSSDRPGGYGEWNIWVTRRQTRNDPWEEPVNLGPTINSGTEGTPNISPDGLTLLFASSRPGGYGKGDIWLSRRKSKDDPWQEPVNLGPPVNDSGGQWAPCISHDGSTLYFTDGPKAPKYGCFDLWQVSIEPLVDLNGDGMVDVKDVVTLTDHWGENNSLCDIGPMPWGDGIVDVQDLLVLADYLEPPVRVVLPVAHWTLDETEGMVVGDTAGDNQAYAVGDPVWKPDSGKVGGALLFDGVDDFISAPAVLNPADGPFSVLVWVQAGAPGQGIISESNGPCWLCLDHTSGNLMTELASAGRSAAPLISQTAINDGNWHRIGFVWDGSNRILCVDEAIVAQDTQDGLDSTGNGLYIGCGDPLQPGTFFSGMIDDIRIYNRAVSP